MYMYTIWTRFLLAKFICFIGFSGFCPMVPILDGCSEIVAYVRCNLLRHLIRSRAVTNRIFFISKEALINGPYIRW